MTKVRSTRKRVMRGASPPPKIPIPLPLYPVGKALRSAYVVRNGERFDVRSTERQSRRENMITKNLEDAIEMMECLTDEELERIKLWIVLEDLKKAVRRS